MKNLEKFVIDTLVKEISDFPNKLDWHLDWLKRDVGIIRIEINHDQMFGLPIYFFTDKGTLLFIVYGELNNYDGVLDAYTIMSYHDHNEMFSEINAILDMWRL